MSIGVFPIRNHYYEPLFDMRDLKRPLSDNRALQGIDWNTEVQLAILEDFNFNNELLEFPKEKKDDLTFHYENEFFGPGDAEHWYNSVRKFKPNRVFEIGSGNSTLLAAAAIRKNKQEDGDYACRHVCIEPYENRWLEEIDVTVVRKKVEDIDTDFFSELGENDILFIDSSHVIRPQGDVLFEFLTLLPTLSRGVIVHVHDIFTPKDYPKGWIVDDIRLWNEQYLLEAFISHNTEWEIIGALNFLKHNHYENLASKCPLLTESKEPGSFYMRRRT